MMELSQSGVRAAGTGKAGAWAVLTLTACLLGNLSSALRAFPPDSSKPAQALQDHLYLRAAGVDVNHIHQVPPKQHLDSCLRDWVLQVTIPVGSGDSPRVPRREGGRTGITGSLQLCRTSAHCQGPKE